MIEPYETALRNASQGFSRLGFSIVRNDEYATTFSNGTYSIELSTDRYYHPELCGGLGGGGGGRGVVCGLGGSVVVFFGFSGGEGWVLRSGRTREAGAG